MPTVAVGTGGVTGQSVGRIARSAFFLRLDGFDIMIIEICGREMDVQIIERIGQCNGCSACILGCRERAIKMIADENGNKYPRIEEDACSKCNNCVLYCPEFNPVELPEYEKFYEYDDRYYTRDMPPIYRDTLRKVRNGEHVEFVGTLCQVAGLKSVMGDSLPSSVAVSPLYCDSKDPKRPECVSCRYWK